MRAADRVNIRDWLLAKFDKQIDTARGVYERTDGTEAQYRAAQARLKTWHAAREEIVNAFKEGEKKDD